MCRHLRHLDKELPVGNREVEAAIGVGVKVAVGVRVAVVPPGEGHSVVCLAAAIKCFNVLSRSFSYWLSVRNFYINLLLGDSLTERAKAKGV